MKGSLTDDYIFSNAASDSLSFSVLSVGLSGLTSLDLDDLIDSIFLFLEEDSSVSDYLCSFSDGVTSDPLDAALPESLVKTLLSVGTGA